MGKRHAKRRRRSVQQFEERQYKDIGQRVQAAMPEIPPGVPVGVVLPYAGASAPADYLMCDGSAYSPTTYPLLFATIGNTYGGTVSSPLLPDCRSRAVIGAGTGPGLSNRPLGTTVGQETITLGVASMPSHTHVTSGDIGTNTSVGGSSTRVTNIWDGNTGGKSITSTSAGGDGAHGNMQPSIALNFIIRAT